MRKKRDILLLNRGLLWEFAFYVGVKLKVVENKTQTVRGMNKWRT